MITNANIGRAKEAIISSEKEKRRPRKKKRRDGKRTVELANWEKTLEEATGKHMKKEKRRANKRRARPLRILS